MKNIHVLPKNVLNQLGVDHYGKTPTQIKIAEFLINKNIYITFKEYIGLSYYLDGDLVRKGVIDDKDYWEVRKDYEKIILTTDQDLIKDGIQPIDDEFLEWFVKNSSCESVEVANDLKYFNVDELRKRHLKGLPHLYSESIGYKIIIPSEKPKQVDEKGKPLTYWGGLEDVNNQETIEEAAKKQWGNVHRTGVLGFIGNYWFKKFQQEQDKKMYSEEEVLDILFELSCNNDTDKEEVEEWFEQFKKK
jgi:hypothetical protein